MVTFFCYPLSTFTEFRQPGIPTVKIVPETTRTQLTNKTPATNKTGFFGLSTLRLKNVEEAFSNLSPDQAMIKSNAVIGAAIEAHNGNPSIDMASHIKMQLSEQVGGEGGENPLASKKR